MIYLQVHDLDLDFGVFKMTNCLVLILNVPMFFQMSSR